MGSLSRMWVIMRHSLRYTAKLPGLVSYFGRVSYEKIINRIFSLNIASQLFTLDGNFFSYYVLQCTSEHFSLMMASPSYPSSCSVKFVKGNSNRTTGHEGGMFTLKVVGEKPAQSLGDFLDYNVVDVCVVFCAHDFVFFFFFCLVLKYGLDLLLVYE